MANGQDFSELVQQITDSPEVQIGRKRAARRADVAEAGARSDLARRGLTNQTGTSDIEFSARANARSPIEEAQALAEAGIISRGVEQERGRRFQTSEREAGQGFRTGEREAGQQFQTGEREATQGFRTGERQAGQEFQTGEREAGQEFSSSERQSLQKFQRGERLSTQEFLELQNALDRQNRLESAKAGRSSGGGGFLNAGIAGLASGIGSKLFG